LGKVVSSIKQHPVVTAAIGASAGLLIVDGVRRVMRSRGSESNEKDRGQDSTSDDSASDMQDTSEDQSGAEEGSEGSSEDDDEEDPTAQGQSERAEEESGQSGGGVQQFVGGAWREYPLLICAAALGVGAAAGLLIPSTSLEDNLLGKAADQFGKRLKDTGESLKEMVSKAYEQVASTAAEEAIESGSRHNAWAGR